MSATSFGILPVGPIFGPVSMPDHGSHRPGYAELRGGLLIFHSIQQKLSYLTNLGFRRLAKMAVVSNWEKARGYGVAHISRLVTPFQVLNAVIGSNAVKMVNAWKIFWIRNECLSNKSMNRIVAISSANEVQIPLCVELKGNWFPFTAIIGMDLASPANPVAPYGIKYHPFFIGHADMCTYSNT